MVRDIEIDIGSGLRFAAHSAGSDDAPLVLLLHGFPQTRHTWRHELPALAKAGYRAVAPDQRGYSPRARPTGVESYATERLVGDALAMADALGAERFGLIGHDWGGQLAWLLAARHPERVRALAVLSRPHPQAFRDALRTDRAQGQRSSHHRSFQSADMTDRLLADGARRLRRSLVHQGVSDVDADAYLAVLGQRDALDAALHWYRAAAKSAESESGSLGAAAAAIRVPTLYVWGDADATVGRAAAEGTARYVTGPYRFHVVPGAGHFLTDQRPDAVAAALEPWLAEHAPARAPAD